MAKRVKVLSQIAGIDYGKAEAGELMVWPEGSDLDSLIERKMVQVIGKESGVSNMIKPYLLTSAMPGNSLVRNFITTEKPVLKLL